MFHPVRHQPATIAQMPDLYIFADEAGELAFHAKSNRYFILTTVTLADCSLGDQLLQLRRQLAWERVETTPDFHATEELQAVRDRVFDVLEGADFRIDATIFDKPKVQPHRRISVDGFYQFAWFYHLRYVAPQVITDPATRLLVVPATIASSKQKQHIFAEAVRSVVSQTVNVAEASCAFWRGQSDPCLWVADYCSWAIQRKWEQTWQGGPDVRSYNRIHHHIASEFDIFAPGTKRYY
jgi:hypothetical protein